MTIGAVSYLAGFVFLLNRAVAGQLARQCYGPLADSGIGGNYCVVRHPGFTGSLSFSLGIHLVGRNHSDLHMAAFLGGLFNPLKDIGAGASSTVPKIIDRGVQREPVFWRFMSDFAGFGASLSGHFPACISVVGACRSGSDRPDPG